MLNAFALPGGFIGVHTGLVLAAQSESELAGVMAHEIGHVTQRHIARMLAKQRESAALALGALLLALLASRAGGSSGGDLAQAAIVGTQAAMIQQQLNFSREAEREADRVGFQTLTDGGFDSRGMEGFFGRLQSGTRIYESAAPAYLRTHPMTVERISDMQNRTRNLRVKQRAGQPGLSIDPRTAAGVAGDDDTGLARCARILQRATEESNDSVRDRGALRNRRCGIEAEPARPRSAGRAGCSAAVSRAISGARQGRRRGAAGCRAHRG